MIPRTTALSCFPNPPAPPNNNPTKCKHPPPRWNLRILDLSHNQLSGAVPPTLGAPAHLSTLQLSHNQLTGRLPDNFSAPLDSVEELDISNNRLTAGEALAPWMALERCDGATEGFQSADGLFVVLLVFACVRGRVYFTLQQQLVFNEP